MPVQRLTIKDFLESSRGHLVLDVRSPGEFQHAHIPGAISFPLFSDEERKIIGTAYKQESREKAIRLGLDFFGPKMRSMVEQVETWLKEKDQEGENAKNVFVHCWRGGMRSGAVAWLLDMYGFRIATLAGGYKSFRNEVLRCFELPFQFRVLGGFTGSGKTELLQELRKAGEPVIDLEGLASHKGSAFGAFNMPPQPTQEQFENNLYEALVKESQKGQPVWLEDESQRIGNLNIPQGLWQNMRSSPIVFLDIPFEERLYHIVQEYGSWNREKLLAAVERISKRLGGLETKMTRSFLEEGNIIEAFRILLSYYDKRYFKGLHNRAPLEGLLTKIECPAVDASTARLLTKYHTV